VNGILKTELLQKKYYDEQQAKKRYNKQLLFTIPNAPI
jgi:hypothetical protein